MFIHDKCFRGRERTALTARIILIASCLLVWSARRGEADTAAPFSIQQQGETFWLTKPGGERFFSLGVCVVNQGASRERFNPTNPAYAAFQHYENSNRWAEGTLKRLRSWRFTTVEGWSDFAALQQCGDADVAFIPVLAVGMSCGGLSCNRTLTTKGPEKNDAGPKRGWHPLLNVIEVAFFELVKGCC
jgi:hypothetical protein